MLHIEHFGYTVCCEDPEQAIELGNWAARLGLLTTRTIVLGQYLQIVLDEHERHDEAREAWEECLLECLVRQTM